jgi:tRNA (guanine37-N1)-methyltransferase
MTFHIITIFPHIFDSYFNESIIKRALDKKKIEIKIYNLRSWTTDKHKTVDDTPYGGGAGMVMKVEPIHKAIKDIELRIMNNESWKKEKIIHNSKFIIHNSKRILLSAKGKTWNQAMARKFSKLENIIFVCGRYEGVDERVKKFVDEEISIGDYVLTGGEIGAMAIIDSITRLLPGVLGNSESLSSESHTITGQLEYAQYTRPEVFEAEGKKLRVPKVLLSGNHKEIEGWRKRKTRTKKISVRT